ncbi:MAG: lytic transglycosylase domain-containing protein [Dehalococcoidia bacterium]
MSTEAVGPGFSLPSAISRPAAVRPSPGSASFGDALGRLLAEPRAEISAIRSEVGAIRAGAPIFQQPRVISSAVEMTSAGGLTGVPGWLEAQLATQATGDIADPYGWRGTSRQIGERVIGPGYGALFERQMQQESGFLPEVVYGLRVSTAGAEGIAQLMPQYYPHVDRTDPVAGLQAGAESMRQYLGMWDGDVRKALASYNAGPGRIQSLVASLGANWETGLPHETRTYLAAIVGHAAPRFSESGTVPGVPEASGVEER